MDGSVDPDFHVQLRDHNRLGFYQYANILEGAFLLVADHISEDGTTATDLVLVTRAEEYLRVSGQWIANNGATVVDVHGGFQGSPVALLLQEQAVCWWDRAELQERTTEYLQFCSPFPYLYFFFGEMGVPLDLLMDTGHASWKLSSSGEWVKTPRSEWKSIERQKIIESFIMASREEIADLLSRPWASHSDKVRLAIDSGLLAAIPLSLAPEAILWWRQRGASETLGPLQEGRHRSMLEGLSRPRLLVDDSGRICELVVSIDEILWVRERNQWIAFDRHQARIFAGYRRELPVNITRLLEVCVWWDHRAVFRPDEKLAPQNLQSQLEGSLMPEYGDVEIQDFADTFHEFFDGVRYWLQQEEYWVVSGESMWADEIERLLPDQDTPF